MKNKPKEYDKMGVGFDLTKENASNNELEYIYSRTLERKVKTAAE